MPENNFRLLMISAMYENGGNTTQRLLDGHPELITYPYESQLGSKYVQDYLSSLYPLKYRWPVFPLHQTVAEDYETIIDEECRVRIKTPQSSKFRDQPIALKDSDRKNLFLQLMQGKQRTRANLVEAFFRASAQAWKDRQLSDRETIYVGYSPIIGVDADKIVTDFPEAHVVNVVRNPWSAYADTKKRAVPLPLTHYITGWLVHQHAALAFAAKFPERIHIIRYEDIVANPAKSLSELLRKVGVSPSDVLAKPSWNGKELKEIYPWGTIRTATAAANQATADELSGEEKNEIRTRTDPLLSAFGYG